MNIVQSDPLTKQKLLDAAQELMLAKGYTATSVDEICEAAGLTKGSFFHYFEGKEHMGRLVAERFFSSRKEMFLSAAFRLKKDPWVADLGFADFLTAIGHSRDGGKGVVLAPG